MKNQNKNTDKEISPEEQAAIDKINEQQSGVKESDTKEKEPEKKSDTVVAEKPETPKKQKHSGEIIQEGMSDGANFIPFENGKLPDAYKEQTKDWKRYKKFSDGSIEM